MYIKIRKLGAPQGEGDLILNVSKMMLIEQLRELIFEESKIPIEEQFLLCKGKQLVDNHKIVDYSIQLNDVIQLMVKKVVKQEEKENETKALDESVKEVKQEDTLVDAESIYFKVGDFVDINHATNGAWYEGTIEKILKNQTNPTPQESDLIFLVKSEDEIAPWEFKVTSGEIRPRCFYTYETSSLKPNMIVLVNYNVEEPKSRGPWFDFKIESATRTNVKGTLLIGKDKTPIEKCTLKFVNEIMRIEEPILLAERQDKEIKKPPLRKYPYNCEKCKDDKDKKCRECGCKICAGKNDWNLIILCDECNFGFHIGCLKPALEKVPDEDDWYCSGCKTDDSKIVKAGEKLKESKKKAKMASSTTDSKRDWGKGMACVGRTKECTIVPKDHFGPIPGVEVGTCWKFRFQVSEAGIHRPHVAGIHGREGDGAFSLVLSGGYEDDIDNGEDFYYTGSGGRDLSGNKRTNEQSSDQKLTLMNKALALNCYAKFNNAGAESTDWKKGKPVRVVRNYKLRKHSKYAPKEGNRYDGIYKIVKYYPEKGLSGFVVWRYFLRRDDPVPAPWSEGGQELDMIYPEGYLEAQKLEEKKKEEEKKNKENPKGKTPKKGLKRKFAESPKSKPLTDFFNASPKRAKVVEYKISEDVEKLILEDVKNEKLWSQSKESVKDGKLKFLSKLEELFMCICCQELAYLPVTTDCNHNICKDCLKRSFLSKIYNCPHCRFELGKDYSMVVNEPLSSSLKLLFPGYEATRQ